MRRAYSIVVSAGLAPALILGACLVLAVSPTLVPAELSGLVRYGPFLLAVLGGAIGWWFNRGRAVFVMLLLLVCYWLLVGNGAGISAEGLAFLRVATLYLIPINLLLLGFTAERGVLNPRGIARMLVLGLQIFVMLMLAGQPDVGSALHRVLDTRFFVSTGILGAMPHPAMIISVIAVILLLIRHKPLETSFAAAIIAIDVATVMGTGIIQYGYLAATGVVLAGLAQEAWRMAFVDDLTGLPGRRALGHAMAELGNQYAIAMLDVDHFKKFNDTYGHDVGDIVLKKVARELARVGGGGKAYRYGGEEFAVLFAGRSSERAAEPLDALRKRIAENKITPPEKNKSVSVTISVGVCERDEDTTDPWAVLKSADQKLYQAKQSGRNRVVI
ncbi:GGDEF domain-containing protein [Thalassospira tepidiphila]|uniref:diguanylate cyclase n=2 Tax=Thalassospira tepidiphila TaxID=393657 RepID=A0A853KV85_9PROT|nr:GGDEF domain-containing protein [Thalassospira tepidiphila]NJB76260.1 diguanylate cyclase (GGDEF)-like protein [Thalassospira tepidiphila]OAZ07781.1 diguanylate cyclase [Thalassospira tepidiphila MCCC 1A03514]